jgi:hypothetical protein
MTLLDIWDEYKENTTQVSEIGRKLAFGGAAICWFFKTPEATFPMFILLALLAIVLYFTCDVLQHL